MSSQAVVRTQLSVAQMVRIVAARLYFRLGWPGCAGLILALLSVAAWAWLHHEAQHSSPLRSAWSSATAVSTRIMSPEPARITPPSLPHAADAVSILKHIKAVVQANGLAWPQADYRITPFSEEGLSTLEIRTTLKGPYAKLRQLVTTLLDKEPALAMRELTLSRQNSDAPEVQAKIRWVVFLADGWAPAEAGGRP